MLLLVDINQSGRGQSAIPCDSLPPSWLMPRHQCRGHWQKLEPNNVIAAIRNDAMHGISEHDIHRKATDHYHMATNTTINKYNRRSSRVDASIFAFTNILLRHPSAIPSSLDVIMERRDDGVDIGSASLHKQPPRTMALI
ncbi:uncharacterized protein EAE97_006414 [Botrytis byssoidea]|uniref:Uncharacterized protein n=1 Tax=Botrytis byssoidea TaxID=139641 RepID=A0A9P5IJ62_9HELO|nr:uncharacterized protein EAE97_006414 [Botrytis byssoidea]KAF7942960.1 hypothetical protein EAE97_006414 [Botrytis byssoidea]